jgi:RNA polymerase sigma-70 factor (ECF subfamily)
VNEPQKKDWLTDEELIILSITTADNRWMGVLLERYTLLMLGVAMNYLKNRTRAENAVQQVFLKVITYHYLKEINNFKGWLYVLVRNYCLQVLRNQKIIQTLEEIAESETEKVTPLDITERKEQELRDALLHLSYEQKVVIELFYLKDQSYEQIMRETGYSFMQVKSYIQNGKRNLKNILNRNAGD